jgi:hypothetical protein
MPSLIGCKIKYTNVRATEISQEMVSVSQSGGQNEVA